MQKEREIERQRENERKSKEWTESMRETVKRKGVDGEHEIGSGMWSCNEGTVKIITLVELIKKGDKVGSSEAALLAKLGNRPFSYGLVVLSIYDEGSVFSAKVLDLTDEQASIIKELLLSFSNSLFVLAHNSQD
ncbi:60s acidic ribosomal protein p0 [Quercus suber]|uniref:60s acidic ribosomal protein p0 n=1 Tax=Quercus suber TaxID=58331 RepID=A0AAW0III7_QUESU